MRVDLGECVEDHRAGPGVLLIAGHGVGEGQPVRPLLVGLDDPRVVRADEVVDAAVGRLVAGPLIGVVGVGQHVTLGAAHRPGSVEAAVRASPASPAAAADRAAGEAVGEGRARFRRVLANPVRVCVHDLVGPRDHPVGECPGPLVLLDVLASALHVVGSEVDGRMKLPTAFCQIHLQPPLPWGDANLDRFVGILEEKHLGDGVVDLLLVVRFEHRKLHRLGASRREAHDERTGAVGKLLAHRAPVRELKLDHPAVGVERRLVGLHEYEGVNRHGGVETELEPLRECGVRGARPPGVETAVIDRFGRVFRAGPPGGRGCGDRRAQRVIATFLVDDLCVHGLR